MVYWYNLATTKHLHDVLHFIENKRINRSNIPETLPGTVWRHQALRQIRGIPEIAVAIVLDAEVFETFLSRKFPTFFDDVASMLLVDVRRPVYCQFEVHEASSRKHPGVGCRPFAVVAAAKHSPVVGVHQVAYMYGLAVWGSMQHSTKACGTFN